MKKKGLEYAEPVLTVEHKGEHFSFTKVTSPLGSVTSVVCGFESRRPHQRIPSPSLKDRLGILIGETIQFRLRQWATHLQPAIRLLLITHNMFDSFPE